jgi:phage portal protein BeeE
VGLRQRARVAWDGLRQVMRTPVVPDDIMPGYAYSFSYGTPNQEKLYPGFEQFAAMAYGGNAVVFGIINRRAQLFSEATFKWRRLADKKLFGNPDLAKLEVPWPGGTAGELLTRMEQDVSLAGNAFIRDCGDRLERLRPDLVTIVSVITTDAHGYQVREVIGYIFDPTSVDSDRSIEYYPVDQVCHWSPTPDPLANFRGMSWLTPVLREINADTAMTQHRDAYFRNAASPNLILKYATQLTKDQKKDIAEQAQARHGGPENAFRTMVLDAGADPMVVGNNMDQAAFTAVQAAGENRIAVAGGVSAIVVGLKEGLSASTLANYDAAVRFTVDWTFRPNWRTCCATLQKLVTVPGGCQLWYDTSDIAALQAGEKEKADTFSVDAATADGLIMAGWSPESVKTALMARDMSLLTHTGLFSVQLQPPGSAQPPAAPGSPTPDAQLNGKPKVPAAIGAP